MGTIRTMERILKTSEAQRRASKKYAEKNKSKRKKLREERKPGYYTVYYIPEHHYVGCTKLHPPDRIAVHRRRNNYNTEGWKVLFCSENKAEAFHHEAMFQSILGINGLNFK